MLKQDPRERHESVCRGGGGKSSVDHQDPNGQSGVERDFQSDRALGSTKYFSGIF